MQRNPLLTLGGFPFVIDTAAYETLLRQTRERWARLEPVGGAVVLQHLGPGEQRMELTGTIYPHWRGGLRQVDELRALQAEGVPHQLVSGQGDVLDYWVIETVEEEQGLPTNGGAPLRQRFRVGLHYYGKRPPA